MVGLVPVGVVVVGVLRSRLPCPSVGKVPVFCRVVVEWVCGL